MNLKRPDQLTDDVLNISWRAARLSEMSYLPEKSFKQTLSLEYELGSQPTVVCYRRRDNVAYVVHYSSIETWVVFRGTVPESRQQVVRDLTYSMNEEDSAGRVHIGFQNQLDELWADIYTELRTSQGNIYVTGHSLGGAVATIASLRLFFACLRGRISGKVGGLITFGSPRVGDREFVSNVNVLNQSQCNETSKIGIWRFRHRSDIVTILPPEMMGFCHAGRTVYIDKHKNIKLDPWLWERFSDRMRWSAFRGSVEDHFLHNYTRALQQHVKNASM